LLTGQINDSRSMNSPSNHYTQPADDGSGFISLPYTEDHIEALKWLNTLSSDERQRWIKSVVHKDFGTVPWFFSLTYEWAARKKFMSKILNDKIF
jgi:hypothetical protein